MDGNNKETLVNLTTGEFYEIEQGDKVKIIPQKQLEAIHKSYEAKEKNEEIKDWNKTLGGFIFALFQYCNQMFQDFDISQEDITKLFYLATYVDYDGYLVLNCAYMKKTDVHKLLNIGHSAFYDFYNKMIKFKIFIEDKETNNIKINKEYFMKGNLNKNIKAVYNYTRIYIQTIRYLYNNVPIKQHSQLGYYFRIIPYIHRQQNILCWNPQSDFENMKPMHVNDLKDILGCHRNTVRSFIKNLLSTRLNTGEAIVGFWRTEYDEGKSYIIVNPKVFYGGNFKLKNGRNDILKWFERK